MRWTRQRRARTQSQGGFPVSDRTARRRTMLMRTVKSCGPDASTPASSLRWHVGPTGLRQALIRGRRRQESPISGESYQHTAHEAAGATGTRHSPRPLFAWAEILSQLGRIAPRDRRGASRFHVIARSDLSAVAQRAKAEATKKSTLSLRGEMDCFANARNDGFKTSRLFEESNRLPSSSPSFRGSPQAEPGIHNAYIVVAIWIRPPVQCRDFDVRRRTRKWQMSGMLLFSLLTIGRDRRRVELDVELPFRNVPPRFGQARSRHPALDMATRPQ